MQHPWAGWLPMCQNPANHSALHRRGKIAAIGGSEIKPSGSAKITTPAGTFDTVAVGYYKGITNSIYIDRNLPFPVKAQTYADVTTGTPPTQYAYELKAMGTGQPAIPKTQTEIPKPPLNLLTPRGSYNLQLLWEPVEIKAGQVTHFGVVFADDKNSICTTGYLWLRNH